MVAHKVIACQCRHLAERAAPERYIVAHKTIEGVYGIEGVIGIVLVQIFCLGNKPLAMKVYACVVHHYVHIAGLHLLRAQHDVRTPRQHQLSLGREVDVLGPEVLLVGESRTIEYSGL